MENIRTSLSAFLLIVALPIQAMATDASKSVREMLFDSGATAKSEKITIAEHSSVNSGSAKIVGSGIQPHSSTDGWRGNEDKSDTAVTARPQPVADKVSTVLQVNLNSSSWNSNALPRREGGQSVAYVSLGINNADKYGISFYGSFAKTRYNNKSSSISDFSSSNILDTTVSGYYTIDVFSNFSLRTGLDLNLPTGKTAFTTEETKALFSDKIISDLILAPSLGRGLNIAPNMVLSGTVGTSTMLGFGARYEITGAYDSTSDIKNDAINPGDFLSLFVSVQQMLTKYTILFLDVGSTMFTRDVQNGQGQIGKVGDQYTATATIVSIDDNLRMTYGFSYGFQGKNQGKSTVIETESRNSNNNQYEAFVNSYYQLTPQVGLSGNIIYKFVDKNDYSSADTLYDAGYDNIQLGVGMTYNISASSFFIAQVSGFNLNNKKDGVEARDSTYTGFKIDIGIVQTLF